MRLRCGSILLICALAFVLAPSTAMAKKPKHSAIIGVHWQYVAKSGQTTATITGRLTYRKKVRRSGKVKTLFKPMEGGVYLDRRSDRNWSRWVKVGWAKTHHGWFTLTAPRGGEYRIRHVRNRFSTTAYSWTDVYESPLSIRSLRGVSASMEPSGSIFVTVEADLQSPASMISSATPGYVYLHWGSKVRDPYYAYYYYSPNYIRQAISRPGVYRFGFSVPAEEADKLLPLDCAFDVNARWTWNASKEATLVPNELLP